MDCKYSSLTNFLTNCKFSLFIFANLTYYSFFTTVNPAINIFSRLGFLADIVVYVNSSLELRYSANSVIFHINSFRLIQGDKEWKIPTYGFTCLYLTRSKNSFRLVPSLIADRGCHLCFKRNQNVSVLDKDKKVFVWDWDDRLFSLSKTEMIDSFFVWDEDVLFSSRIETTVFVFEGGKMEATSLGRRWKVGQWSGRNQLPNGRKRPEGKNCHFSNFEWRQIVIFLNWWEKWGKTLIF